MCNWWRYYLISTIINWDGACLSLNQAKLIEQIYLKFCTELADIPRSNIGQLMFRFFPSSQDRGRFMTSLLKSLYGCIFLIIRYYSTWKSSLVSCKCLLSNIIGQLSYPLISERRLIGQLVSHFIIDRFIKITNLVLILKSQKLGPLLVYVFMWLVL